MNSELLFLIISSLLIIFIALVVSLSHGVNRWAKILFTAICLSLTLWQVTIFIADSVNTYLTFWNNLVFLWPIISVVSTFFFVLLIKTNLSGKVLPSREVARNRVPSTIVLAAGFIQLILVPTRTLFSNVIAGTGGQPDVFTRGIGYPIYTALLMIQLVTIVVYLVRSLKRSKPYTQERHAIKVVLATIVLVIAYAVFTNILIPLLTGSQRFISLGILSIDIFATGFALSIIRYKFLDIRSYAFRAGVYLLVFSIVVAAYVLFSSLIVTNILKINLTGQAIALLSALTLVIAVSFQPLKAYFNKVTNKFFYRDYYEPQLLLDKISTLLVGTVEVTEIKAGTKSIIEDTFKPSNFKFVIQDGKRSGDILMDHLSGLDKSLVAVDELDQNKGSSLRKVMLANETALALKLQTTHEDLGYMLLGPRRSGAMYTSADKRILRTIADEIAIGLQNALRFEEIERFNETLQQKVEDATRKLRRTNEKLRQLDETKDDFISMASHQLRTPLTSVKGYVSMVIDGDAGSLTPLQKKLLNQSFISAQRMVYLISDLLNVSRLRTGKFVIEPIQCNLANMIQEEVKQLVETAKGRGLELVYHKPEHFPTLMLDETKMRQVIMNFIDNAIYYTQAGGTITINLTETPQSIEFTVVDNGIGVPKAEQHHLFSKFFRAHNAKRARPDGTGLGLFMAKKVIVAQGGAIIFKSQEGKGSTFGFSFAKRRLLLADEQPTPEK